MRIEPVSIVIDDLPLAEKLALLKSLLNNINAKHYHELSDQERDALSRTWLEAYTKYRSITEGIHQDCVSAHSMVLFNRIYED